MIDCYKGDDKFNEVGIDNNYNCPLPLMELNFTPKLTFEESTMKEDFIQLNEIMKQLDEGVANGNQQQIVGSLEAISNILKFSKKGNPI